MSRAPAPLLSALLMVGCGFATEPDPGHFDPDGGAIGDLGAAADASGEGGAGGAGGEGGGLPGDPDLGLNDAQVAQPDAAVDGGLVDMQIPGPDDMGGEPPADMGCPPADAGCVPCDCDDGLCDCDDSGLRCDAPLCVDLGVEPLPGEPCDDVDCADLGAE